MIDINKENYEVKKRTLLVTGCCGFIGSCFTQKALEREFNIIGIDSETYASRKVEFKPEMVFGGYQGYTKPFGEFKYIKEDICNSEHLPAVDYIVNFAAETHVDNSIINSTKFLHSNVIGVHNLLELVRGKRAYERPVFIQISTDEVFGSITNGSHLETDVLSPSNPYSATKAAADMLVQAYGRTYDMPYMILRPTNNYGLDQYPEKLIPKTIKFLTQGKKVPIHGKGLSRRTWLHIEDTANAILTVIEKGNRNEIYNISGNIELTNIEVVNYIANTMVEKGIISKFENINDICEYNYVRQGEDVRYSLDDSKLRALGWSCKKDFYEEIEKIVTTQKIDYLW